jgi:hypothetical protein
VVAAFYACIGSCGTTRRLSEHQESGSHYVAAPRRANSFCNLMSTIKAKMAANAERKFKFQIPIHSKTSD